MHDPETIIEAHRGGRLAALDGDPKSLAEGLHAAAKKLYWAQKDVAAARACLERGIDVCTQHRADTALAGAGKAMHFDLASFCWPGWGETGVKITADDVAAGERSAAMNLTLAVELKRGPGPMANAHWMLGAYHLQADRRREASAAFAVAAGVAEQPAMKLMLDGYVALAARQDAELRATIDRLKQEHGDDGRSFAEQLETARRIYNP